MNYLQQQKLYLVFRRQGQRIENYEIYNSRNYTQSLDHKDEIIPFEISTIVEIILSLQTCLSSTCPLLHIYNSRNYTQSLDNLMGLWSSSSSTIVEIILSLQTISPSCKSTLSTIVEIILSLQTFFLGTLFCFIYNSRNYTQSLDLRHILNRSGSLSTIVEIILSLQTYQKRTF